jgi:hypothetical protein
MRVRRAALAALALLLLSASAAQARVISIGELKLSNAKLNQLRSDWVDQLTAKYGTHTWAPMKFDLGDRDLKLMGLPSKKVLTSHRYRTPTAVVGGKLVPLPKLDQYLAAKAARRAAAVAAARRPRRARASSPSRARASSASARGPGC